MNSQSFATTPGRALLGLLAGTMTASVIWSVFGVLFAIATGSFSGFDLARLGTPGGLIALLNFGTVPALYAYFAALAYGVGLTTLGIPAWALMHAAGRRNSADAAALGAGLSFGVASVLLLAVSPTMPAVSLLPAAACATIGAAVGWVIWRVAYRRAA